MGPGYDVDNIPFDVYKSWILNKAILEEKSELIFKGLAVVLSYNLILFRELL